MKKILIILLFIPLIFACSSEDNDDNSNLTFFEKYDGVVWEVETFNNGMIPDKSLTNRRWQFFNGDNSFQSEHYRYENNGPNSIIDECFSYQFLGAELSNISENGFTYENDTEIVVFIVKDNGTSLSITESFKSGGEPDATDIYFRTSLNNPCP